MYLNIFRDLGDRTLTSLGAQYSAYHKWWDRFKVMDAN